MAAIVRKRLFRTGDINSQVSSADWYDEWLVVVDEQIDKKTFLELVYDDPDLPNPYESFQPLGNTFAICTALNAKVNAKQRLIWLLKATWKTIDQAQATPETDSTPTVDSIDPTDWSPIITRRPVIIQEPMTSAFYEGGYGSQAHSQYQAQATSGERSPLTNSGLQPFQDNLPPHQRVKALWTIRWLRTEIPTTLFGCELKLNETDVSFSHRGYTENWSAKTAKIEPIAVSQTKWGNQSLWEIVMEVLHDSEGHFETTLDLGLEETYFSGDSLGGSSVTSTTRVPIKDDESQRIRMPVFLDGSGKQSDTEVFAKWRDFDLIDFRDVPLLADLITAST